MKIILGVDSIRSPLTGIGKYTWELASRLPVKNQVEQIKYFAHGKWQTFEHLQNKAQSNQGATNIISLRKIMHNRYLHAAYGKIAGLLTSLQIRRLENYVFHGPNYFVPKLDIASVVTVHDLSTFKDASWHPASRVKRINSQLPASLQQASIVLTDSQAIRTEVIDYFNVPHDKVIAIPLGVDHSFQPRKKSDLDAILDNYNLKYDNYTLCVATIEPRKNILRLIQAYKRLPASFLQRWPLVLIGECGWNNQIIMKEIKEAQQAGWLKYFGYIIQEHLPLIYAGCRLFVYPSLYEGFGLPILEAMASGVPVITSNCSSMPEVTEQAACLINPEDEDALHRSLQQCLEDEAWQNNAKQLGLAQASKFNWDCCVDKTIAAYKLALKT